MDVSAMTPGCSTICSDPSRCFFFFFFLLQMLACNNAKPSEHMQNVLHYRACLKHIKLKSTAKPDGLKQGQKNMLPVQSIGKLS